MWVNTGYWPLSNVEPLSPYSSSFLKNQNQPASQILLLKEPSPLTSISLVVCFTIETYKQCQHFTLTSDTDISPTDQNHIIFNVYYKKLKLQFKIEIGLESSNFASEVIRSKEGKSICKSKHIPS